MGRAERPRHGISNLPPPKALNVLELVALFLVRPHLITSTLGTVFPGIFRNTPLTNAHLDLQSGAGLAVLLAPGLMRWRRMRRGAATVAEGSRSVDVLAPARSGAPQPD